MGIFKTQAKIVDRYKQEPEKFLEELDIAIIDWFPENSNAKSFSAKCPFHKSFVSFSIVKNSGLWSCDDGCEGDIITLVNKLTTRKC